MRWWRLTAAALGAAAIWPAAALGGQAGQPAATVDAEGNPFTPGSLRFDPAAVTVRVGEGVRWTNTNLLVPHTATEDHSLWRLTGTYGATPANPPGFGPGESRQRIFSASTWSYFCEVHPADMRGTVSVPVSLRERMVLIRGRTRFRVIARWGGAALPAGQVFDLQRKRGPGPWRTVRRGTRKLRGSFRGGPAGRVWSFRARVRDPADPGRASGYSPVARITVG